ncbi:MAG: hypothetical protein DIZ80_02840 [endosymbiont of Galathealinum brachiosum]|uniref:SPOR domain-containing protein n=1 Tax=endosymbiont of Galathealinum brachiosum TaxID=2200906 RepID=A0A370DHS4_9GAMM|nr:MAG: hypothetical protein DIZ80_02840 [endosymbiont of Galathealinum brachiosum]
MSVFVINEDQIKKIILAFVVAVVISFLLGYFTGAGNLFKSDRSDQFDKAQTKQTSEAGKVKIDQAGDTLKPEKKNVLIDREKDAKESADKKAAEKKAADKRAKDKKAKDKKIAEKKKADRKAAEKKKAEKKAAEKRLADKKKAAEKKIEEAKKQAAIKEAARKKQADKNLQADGVDQTDVEAVSNARFYSIQAGMFASESNAGSFIDKLSEKQFDAYVSSFVSSSGATKYNVRVGKFEKRDQARTLLKEFQKSFSSPAYVVITH